MLNSALAPVVPPSIARAKRVAKRLHDIYPNQPLSVCQAVTARIYGHGDWHALEQAVKAKTPSAPFDDDLSSTDWNIRRDAQQDIVCRDLGGFDPAAESSPPEHSAFDDLGGNSALISARLERASQRRAILQSAHALIEISPTSAKQLPAQEYHALFGLYPVNSLENLPAALAQWWSVNIPHQPGVAEPLRTYELDPHSPTSLIRFGGYWGTLCMHYADVIDWGMAKGTAFLLADRYGVLATQESDAWWAFVERIGETTEAENEADYAGVMTSYTVAMETYFKVYPRDDFIGQAIAEPVILKKAAKACIKILENPKSRKGTWKRSKA